MTRTRILFALLTAALSSVMFSPDGQKLAAQSSAAYTITEIPLLEPAYFPSQTDNWAADINSHGDVVGYSKGAAFFRWRDGFMKNLFTETSIAGKQSEGVAVNNTAEMLGTVYLTTETGQSTTRVFKMFSAGNVSVNIFNPTAQFEFAVDMNNNGEFIGRGVTNNFADQYGYYSSGGGFQRHLGYLDAQITFTQPKAINNLGQIVGISAPPGGGIARGFIMHHSGNMSPLIPSGFTTSTQFWPEDINDQGQVAGERSEGLAGSTRAVIYNHNLGTYLDIAPADSFASWATGINNHGHVVGYGQNYLKAPIGTIDVTHAFLYKDGVYRKLNDLIDPNSGWDLLEAWRVNDSGQIIGFGYNYNISAWRAFVLNPIPTQNTPTGTNVVATPVDTAGGGTPVTLSFGNVVSGGETTLTTAPTGPPPPSGFKIGTPPVYYNLETTAIFTGSATLCIDYSSISYGNENNLKLFHYEAGNWVDRTTSLNTATNVICASVTNFSPFVILERAFTFTGFYAPVDNGGVLNSVKAGSSVPAKFSLDGDMGLDIMASGFPKSVSIQCDPSAPTDVVEETASAGASGLSYDAMLNQYKYIWRTEKSWTGCRQFVMKLIDGSTHTANFKFTK